MSSDYQLEDTVYLPFTTRAFGTGIPTALVSGAIDIYEDVTATPIITAETLTVSLNSHAGFNMITVTATAATGFEAGKSYTAILDAGTVDSVSVIGEVVAHFTLDMSAAAKALASGVNVTSISGDSTAADNLESQYDTTGLAGGTFPATQDQIGGIANVSSASHRAASSYVLTTGTQSSGTVADTKPLDGINHEHTDTAGAMELYYEFLLGGGFPSAVKVTGYLNGNNDDLGVFGFDWIASAWIQIGTLSGKAQSVNEVDEFDMFLEMVGSGADEGKVRVRFFAASGLTSATLAIDQIFCLFTQATEGYDNGAIWLNTLKSNTNTVRGVDGIATNPVSTIAAVNTLIASTGLHRVEVAPGSSVTFAASQDDDVFRGHDWTLALGGQSISSSYIEGAVVSGVATGASPPTFVECTVGTVTLPPCELRRCGMQTTVTAGSAGDFFFNGCFSEVAGTSSPVFNFGAAIGTTNFNMRHYSGGIQVEAMGDTGTDTMSLEGNGQFIEGTCTGGTVAIRGNFTTSGITNLTLSDDARIDVAQINAQADQANTDTPVTLADGAHGGTSAVITVERIIVESTTGNEPAIKATGSGTGSGISVVGGSTNGTGIVTSGGGANGSGIITSGAGTGEGILAIAVGTGTGFQALSISGSDMTGDITGNLSGSVGSNADINTTGGAIDNVTLVATTTTNTDMRGTDGANTTTPPTAIQNADEVLTRDWDSVTGEAARSMLNALRQLRNRVVISGSTLTVYEEDGTTVAWTGTVTTSDAAKAITEIAP